MEGLGDLDLGDLVADPGVERDLADLVRAGDRTIGMRMCRSMMIPCEQRLAGRRENGQQRTPRSVGVAKCMVDPPFRSPVRRRAARDAVDMETRASSSC